MKERHIVVRADYDAHPLLDRTPYDRHDRRPMDDAGDVDPASLPLSQPLIDELLAWGAEYRYNHGRGPFESPEAEKAWAHRGKTLSYRVRQELGDGYIVSFHP